jgi:hypothetical protein
VPLQHLVCRERGRADRGQASLWIGRLHLGEHDVEDAVEQVVLVRNVVVERHRLDVEAGGEGTHRQ